MNPSFIMDTSMQGISQKQLEQYEQLAHGQQFLLPDYRNCPPKFLNQIQAGTKSALKLIDAREFFLPLQSQYPTKTQDLYTHCLQNPRLKKYVPEDKMPNREFLLKIIATLELDTLIELNKLILSKKYKINDDLPLFTAKDPAPSSRAPNIKEAQDVKDSKPEGDDDNLSELAELDEYLDEIDSDFEKKEDKITTDANTNELCELLFD